MVGKEFQDEVKRSSLGRVAFIGELYDLRTENLSSFSLLKPDHPKELIRTTDTHQTEFQYQITEDSSDRCELMNVEGELQLSLLLGLINLDGSGKFLSDVKKSRKTISCSLKCQIQTKNEKLFASTDDYIQQLDITALQDPRYTHVITGISWGTNCLLNLELTCDSEVSKEALKGRLAGAFAALKMIPVKGEGKLKKVDSTFLEGTVVDIKVFADVLPKTGWPTTVDGFFEFVAVVPELLKEVNDGKGKPLSYTMTPLSSLRQMAKLETAVELVVRKIDESFLMSTIFLFKEIEEVKQKFHDLCELLQKRKKYVREEDVRGAGRMKAELASKESDLKMLISEDWVSVRSGMTTLKGLIKRVEQFKNHKLRLYTYEEYLESCSTVVEKLSFVSDCLSKGIFYLGKGETFATLQAKHPTSEFVVLVTSSKMQKADPELHANTLCYFFVAVQESRPDTKYVIIDLDFEQAFSKDIPTVAKIFHLKGTHFLSRDLFRNYMEECESNFVRQVSRSNVDLNQHKPGNRVPLKITCPGFSVCTCSSNAVEWKCFSCRSVVEYGFDNFYYCACGKSPASSFEYRCSDSMKHGNAFVSADEKFLKEELSKLTPLEEMNILVIGQSGVGKSTWINSIVNYLSYESFDTARENGVICTIPTKMVINNPKTGENRELTVGYENENEVTDSGHSATQHSRTYTCLWEGRCVRIIDTPGLGDTRGIDKDKENLRNVIEHIGYLNVLHGVCILLKANDNRFHALFTYCIKELLANLHKSVTKNIVFCFTCSRTSLYSPGQASVVLKKVIKGIGIENELSLGKHNMFPLDNEAFTFLCSLQYTDFEYEEIIKESFAKSWDVSSKETQRLFNTIKTFRPHLLKETLSLVNSRNRVLTLTKPIAEVSKTIQMNVVVMQRKKREIQTSELTIEELRKKLTFTGIKLEPVNLDKPRTVCTTSSCVEYIAYQGTDVSEIEYKTHCHVECYLKKVIPKTVNNPELRNCWAMNCFGNCRVCGCSWDKHMHLTYEQKRVPITLENKFIKEDLTREESVKKKIENAVKQMEEDIAKYKREQEIIIQASVKFGMFLKANAITLYNDSVAEYLEYLIDEETRNPYKSESDKEIIKNLHETLARYREEVGILTEALKKNEEMEGQTSVTSEDVQKIEEELYNLELTGKQIRENVEKSRSSAAAAHRYTEVPIPIPKKPRIRGKFENIWHKMGEAKKFFLPKNEVKAEFIKKSLEV